MLPTDAYRALLDDLKSRVRSARLGAALAANTAVLRLYWDIGRQILERQAALGYGGAVVRRLSHDLRAEFPDMAGLSPTNLNYMRAFAAAWRTTSGASSREERVASSRSEISSGGTLDAGGGCRRLQT